MALFESGTECVCFYTICVVLAVIALKSALELVLILLSNTWIVIQKLVLKKLLIIKQHFLIKLINDTSERNKPQKSYILLFFNHMINIEVFDSSLLK